MDDVPDFDTIDIEVDEDLTKKQISRCTDDFLNSIWEEELDNIDIPEVDQFDEDEAVNTDGEGVNVRENGDDEEQEEIGEYEEQLQYTTHDPSVKWNRMQPVIGESLMDEHIDAEQGKKKAYIELNSDAEQGKKKAKLPVKRRKPSGRIINIKLATKVVDKDGKGMTADKALELD
ncbi:hypothetical protein LXL04_024611 [Taraxacum kok-saghyz]